MKKYMFLLLFFLPAILTGQEIMKTPGYMTPTEGKCMVFIARRSGTAFLLNFSIYDGDLFLGKLAPNKFFAYECEPGKHIFSATSENTDYLEAELEAGKCYGIDLLIKNGILKARVELKPMDKNNKKYEKNGEKFVEFISNKKGELLSVEEDDEDTDTDNENEEIEFINANDPDLKGLSKRMRKFYSNKSKGKIKNILTPDMYMEI